MAKSNYHPGDKAETCYFCDASEQIEEHHIIPRRFDGPDDRDNLVDVCFDCHMKLERLYDSSFYRWFGIEDKANNRRFHRSCVVERCSNTVDFVFQMPTHPKGKKTYLCLDCAKEWFNDKWPYIVKSIWGMGVRLSITEESADIIREFREEHGHRLEVSENDPITETGLQGIEVKELGWDRIAIKEGEEGVSIVDGELDGMDKFDVLVKYSLSFSPRIGKRVDQ